MRTLVMNQVFITSDHHFRNQSMSPRGYLNEFNNWMIERWNTVVTNDDEVFHLGDFSELDDWNTSLVVKQLNGYKTLIMGNHDYRKKRDRSSWLAIGFDEVIEYPILYGQFLLSHSPLSHINVPFFNIHGHYHYGQESKDISDRHYNVSVNYWDHTPVNLNRIKEDIVMRIK